jgi:hypothetical protein
MNFYKLYKDYLLDKTPASKSAQYFWLAASGGILVFVVLQFSTDSLLRSLLLLVICISLMTDAITNLAYYKDKALFAKLVNAKIAANLLSMGYIIVFLILTMKNKL